MLAIATFSHIIASIFSTNKQNSNNDSICRSDPSIQLDKPEIPISECALSYIPSETLFNILKYLPDDEIIAFGWASRHFLRTVLDNKLWEIMINHVFGKKFLPFDSQNLNFDIDLREVYIGLREFFCHNIEGVFAPWPLHTKFRVIDAHNATGGRSDEITVRVGDIVRVHECFVPNAAATVRRIRIRTMQSCRFNIHSSNHTDIYLFEQRQSNRIVALANAHAFLQYFLPCDRRWCYGVNFNTGESGSFRFSCLRMIEGSGGPATVYETPDFIWPGEQFLIRFISHVFELLDEDQQIQYKAATESARFSNFYTIPHMHSALTASPKPWLLQHLGASVPMDFDDNQSVISLYGGTIDFPRLSGDSSASRRNSVSSFAASQSLGSEISGDLFPSLTQFDSTRLQPSSVPSHLLLPPALPSPLFTPRSSISIGNTKPMEFPDDCFSDESTAINNNCDEFESLMSTLPGLTLNSPAMNSSSSKLPSLSSAGSVTTFFLQSLPPTASSSPAVCPFSPSSSSDGIEFTVKLPSPYLTSKASEGIIGRRYTVIRNYERQRTDEISLREGDVVEVKRYWAEDNWCEGSNVTVGSFGMFPMECCGDC